MILFKSDQVMLMWMEGSVVAETCHNQGNFAVFHTSLI